MIINPYNINGLIQSKDEEKLEKNLVEKITEKIINSNKNQIENNNKEALISEIDKLLSCVYKVQESSVRKGITNDVIDKIFGYGILQKYIEDSEITDIRVIAYDSIYIKKLGIWEQAKESFYNEDEFNTYVRFCALKNNAVINTENPICIFSDKKNALRIEAGIPPANVNGPSLVIRIHRKECISSLEELLLKTDMLDVDKYKILIQITKDLKNIIICGKGGSGKTTLLKALLNNLPKDIALTTNEETAELYLNNRNIIQRECLLNRKQDKAIDLEKLTRHCLVMSNDVIVLGEIKRSRGKCVF
ncbi:MAG: CpaF family protein [Clostridia bacterium]|nr:CpaF family protein [Clostridia bacterium]